MRAARRMTPATFVGLALQAVAARQATEVAVQLGISTPAMVQECVRLARDPLVFAQHPRACRVILDRVEQGREARSARSLTIRSSI